MLYNNFRYSGIADANTDTLYASALNEEEPWSTLLDVLSVTNYLSSYFSASGADAASDQSRDLYAVNQSLQNLPLAWSDAVNLFNEYTNTYAKQGQVLTFRDDPVSAAAIVNAIVDSTGLDHDIVWTFFQVLYNECEKRGVPEYIDPSVVSE